MSPQHRTCAHCGDPLTNRADARYCSKRHAELGRRRRRAGLPESSYPDGARRGRVRLGTPTRREHELEQAREEGRRQARSDITGALSSDALAILRKRGHID